MGCFEETEHKNTCMVVGAAGTVEHIFEHAGGKDALANSWFLNYKKHVSYFPWLTINNEWGDTSTDRTGMKASSLRDLSVSWREQHVPWSPAARFRRLDFFFRYRGVLIHYLLARRIVVEVFENDRNYLLKKPRQKMGWTWMVKERLECDWGFFRKSSITHYTL